MADLSEMQWEYVRPFVERDQHSRERADGRGGRWGEARRILNGVLWILRTGAPWKDLPPRYGSYQTCHRRREYAKIALWERQKLVAPSLSARCAPLLISIFKARERAQPNCRGASCSRV